MKIYSFFLFFILFYLQNINAQEERAIVLDASTKKSISYANVIIGENRGTVTNEKGLFSFREEDKRFDKIKIFSIGYELLEWSPKNIENNTIYIVPKVKFNNNINI